MRATNEGFCIFQDSVWSDMNRETKNEHFGQQEHASIISLPLEEDDHVPMTTPATQSFSEFKQKSFEFESLSKGTNLLSGYEQQNTDLPRSTNNSQTVPHGFLSSTFEPFEDCEQINFPKRSIEEVSGALGADDDDDWTPIMNFSFENTNEQPTAAELVEAVRDMPMFDNADLFDTDEDESKAGADASSEADRFRSYQSGQWSTRFRELCEYKEKNGHCLVPHNFSENLALARWVKRQRCQYRRMKEGQHSTISDDRKKALDDIGFVWDYQGDAWEEKLTELRQYREAHGNCDVPYHYEDNRKLAVWVKCQRRQYKLYMEGKQSSITLERIQELENLGFRWGLRSYKKRRTA